LTTAGYTGPPDLTVPVALTSWTVDVAGLALVVALALAYAACVRRLRREGTGWPAGRTVWFSFGLVVLALVFVSFLGVYAHTLFWVTAAQLALLLTVVPVLLVLGAPVTLLTLARPASGPLVERVLASGGMRVLTFPVVGALLVATIPFLVYFTPVFEASLRNAAVAWLVHLAVLVVGFAFYWPVLSVDRPPRVHYFALTVVVMAETLFDAVPGIALWLGTAPIAGDYYRAVARPWGRSLLSDQQFGGIVLWGIGELVGVPLLMLVVIQWMRSDAAEARRIDRELDLAEDARDAAAQAELERYQGIERNGEE
jgi:cytochrome c oxidase assembly factor CtaG